MPKRFTGFSEDYHDAALSIINEDGVVEFAAHAERYTKHKNDEKIPDNLWSHVDPSDHLSFYEDIHWKSKVREPQPAAVGRQKRKANFYFGHHLSHCAGAFYTRPWKDRESTVMVSIDGVGEHQCAVILDNNFNILQEKHLPKSVGFIYSVVTKLLGLRPLEDEYVVMGLASYGTVSQDMLDWLTSWYNDLPDINPQVGQIEIDKEGAFAWDERNSAWAYLKDVCKEKKNMCDADIAATTQAFAEYAIMDIMKEARKYGSKLVYSGGCAQNVVINSKLPDLFDEVHIAVSPTDAGSSLGCAAHAWSKHTGKDRLIWTPYLGYNIDREVNPKEIVDHLLEHKVCGLANGRAEFGPRALGNRSLIADVRYDVKDTVNTIKRRQKYRPFAPAILEEYADQYFEGPMNEYMQYTSKALHDYKSVTHVDGTARVQIVKKDCQSVFRKVIEEYYERTGVPMLLNTSLNIRGRPMVNDEHDARLWEQKYKVKVF